ncbi:MAG: HAD-IA family hydrolase [Plectolyngbya sp. WJT66-NPBG17]|jgi:phosphoglycolate phosphatase|nr:HAD-IA family hydrolase [Plectolyngbya sp. WJT66-NPBG17]
MITIFCNSIRFDGIEAVIFDKDGTLADSHQYLRHLGENRANLIDAIVPNLRSEILKTFGCDRNRIDPAGLMAVGTREDNETAIVKLIADQGYDWGKARAIVQSTFQTADRQLPRKATLTPPFAGIMDLVRSLNSLKLGILSSDIAANIQDFTDQYELSPYFQGIIGAQPGISKPDPKLLCLICKVLNVEPQAALVIGDTIADTKLTQRSIGVTWGRSTIAQLIDAAAIAHHPSDIQLSNS